MPLRQNNLVRLPHNLANIAANRVSRELGAELFDELDARFFGHLEMGGPGDAIELVEVVRHYPMVDEPLEKLGAQPLCGTSSQTPQALLAMAEFIGYDH
jgi:hypothetical protein